ncbi:SpoIID/LytB domain-containing protein [Haloplasma contractile]|uniref:Sporulation protein SpoIID n=1 Tax=Haloplasma contractile SSD-17B TaxID=1033810 RepID=F7PUD6_9MOLU|nr:SpoIID/LytB domain-containing protein [Haloplasma contractile]ERJ11732.1 Sporulation protein SpoIID [Haloplasma contractile SSD-17B]
MNLSKILFLAIIIGISFSLYGCKTNIATEETTSSTNEGAETTDTTEPEELIIDIPDYEHGKILRKDTALLTLEVENIGNVKYSARTKVYQLINDDIVRKSINDLYIGMENAFFYFNEENSEKVDYILIDGPIIHNRVRVRLNHNLSIAGDSDRYHESLQFKADTSLTITDTLHTFETTIDSGKLMNVELSDQKIIVKVDNETVATSDHRLIFTQESGHIYVNSIQRAYGIPYYRGRLEVTIKDQQLMLINDVNLEQYLMSVVPSEMPSYFGSEALQAQSVAARTYAIRDLEKATYERDGYHVDDSVSSQVYNNSIPDTNISIAVNKTKGLVMNYNDTLIDAKYFSTSSGCTANATDVWFDGTGSSDNRTNEYLQSVCQVSDRQNNTVDFNIDDETSMLAFYKMISLNTPDIGSLFHRWKVTLPQEELTATLSANLPLRYDVSPGKILTKVGDSFQSVSIPDDIGLVENISVVERGSGGIVKAIEIKTDVHTFRVYSEYNVRFIIRNINLKLAKNNDLNYTGSRNNFSILPSGYFAIEQDGSTLTFYGGGFGHGAGMSQYGAKGLASQGHNYDYILKFYYSGITIKDLYKNQSIEQRKDGEKLYTTLYDYLSQ